VEALDVCREGVESGEEQGVAVGEGAGGMPELLGALGNPGPRGEMIAADGTG
jgi:hypothetical protein